MKCPHCSAFSKSSARCSNCGEVIVAAIEKKHKRIRPVGAKRQDESYLYGLLREVFLILNPKCGIVGCLHDACEIHHMRGRLGFADAWARLKNISLYLDIRFWLQLCVDHHREVEKSPAKAKEKGYSLDRLSSKE